MAVDGGVFKALLGLAARRTLVCSVCRLGKTASCRLRFKSYHCKCFEFSCFEFSCFRTVQEYPPQFGKAIHHWWRTQKHVLVTHGISWLKKTTIFVDIAAGRRNTCYGHKGTPGSAFFLWACPNASDQSLCYTGCSWPF